MAINIDGPSTRQRSRNDIFEGDNKIIIKISKIMSKVIGSCTT